MSDNIKYLNDPDIKTSALFATFGTAMSNLNLILTCIFLSLNIGFIVWKWSKNRKKKDLERWED